MNKANAAWLYTPKRIHLVGIGGVSMSALGDVLSHMGHTVSGSDMQESDATKRLAEKGIAIHIGHQGAWIAGQDAVIRTAAAKDTNPEIEAARAAGIPVYERAQVWGMLMLGYEHRWCISGTHGKTSTTGMATHIAMAAGWAPTVMMGGDLPLMGGGHRLGDNKLMIAESCEYCNSFLSFAPTSCTILNVEADHLDFFSGLSDIVASFAAFAALTPEQGGFVVINGDDPNAERCIDGLKRPIIRFGKGANCTVTCCNVVINRGYYTFDIWADGACYAHVSLQVPGEHNMLNALAAAAGAHAMGIEGLAVGEGLSSFTGAGRRFQRVGDYHGANIVDDYAHHPTEVIATLKTARDMGYERVVCAFQPHTYTRTAALFDDFVAALSIADRVLITEIYAAREAKTGLSAATLADAIPNATFHESLADVTAALAQECRAGDLVITMGAGNISQVGYQIVGK